MAINDPKKASAATTRAPSISPQAATAAGAALNGASAVVAQRAIGSIFSLNGQGNSPVRPFADAETLRKLNDALVPLYKDAGPGWFIKTLDATANRVPVNALLVCKLRSDKKLFVSTILTQLPAGRLPNRVETWNGAQYELVTTVSDTWNDEFWASITRILKEEVANVDDVVDAGCSVVPANFNPEDETAARRLAHAAGSSIVARAGESFILNMADALNDPKEPARLTGNVQFLNTQLTDAVGRPVRADVVVNIGATSTNKPANGLATQSDILRVAGFVDVNFAGQSAVQLPGMMMPQMGTQAYIAELVITNVEALSLDMDLDRVLLALSAGCLLEENALWAYAFQPKGLGGKKTKGGVKYDPRDIGLLGTEYQPTQGVPAAVVCGSGGGAMSQEELGQFLQEYFYRQLIISLQVDPTGPYSATMNQFVHAGTGNPDAKLAILNAANQLTGGRFQKYWVDGSEICHISRQVPLGTYPDVDGESKDLRYIDHLATLAMTVDDAHARAAMIETVENRQGNPKWVCLANRTRQIQAHLSGAEITGYGFHLRFDPKFLSALTQAMAECGAGIQLNNGQASLYASPTIRQNLELLGYAATGVGQTMHAQQPVQGNNRFGSWAGSNRFTG